MNFFFSDANDEWHLWYKSLLLLTQCCIVTIVPPHDFTAITIQKVYQSNCILSCIYLPQVLLWSKFIPPHRLLSTVKITAGLDLNSED